MGAMPATHHMTAQEYLDLPEPLQRPNTELVEGEIVVNEPTPLHQDVKQELIFAVGGWSRQTPGRGRTWLPLDVLIDERNVFAPDLLWYAEGAGPTRDSSPPSPLPHLAVEVRAPSTWRYVPRFDVALELERDDTLTSPQLDRFELPLVELFPE
jgi:Uma2 family endonuclease